MSAPPSAEASLQQISQQLTDGISVNSTPVESDASNASVAAYDNDLVIKASPGKLFGITGYNSKTSTQFIQLHDSAAAVAEGAAPKVVISVPASSNFSIGYGSKGRSFALGIYVCNSSTGPTKTIGAGDCWFDAQYE